MTLLDADVLIELTRDESAARSWFGSLDELPTIPGIVAMEFVVGSRDRRELSISQKSLRNFEIRRSVPEDNSLAYDLVLRHRLSSGLSSNDYLIAAQALNLGATLYTFNLRHFGAISGLDARAPYQR